MIDSFVYCNKTNSAAHNKCKAAMQRGVIDLIAFLQENMQMQEASKCLDTKRFEELIVLMSKTTIKVDALFILCSFIYIFKGLFDQSCYIIFLIMELAVQNVRKSHKLLMTATFSQLTASEMFSSSNFAQNDRPTALNTSSTSCERKRFKTIQKNGCVRFVQQKQMDAVKAVPDRSETDTNFHHPLRHKRSSTSIQFKSDAVTETMKVRLEGKIQEARSKLEAMKMGFKRCLEKKQEIVNNVKNAKIVTRRYSLAT